MRRATTRREVVMGKMISPALLLAGLTAAISFRLVGGEIDENAILREPFGLVPIAWALILAGGVGLFVSWRRSLRRGRR